MKNSAVNKRLKIKIKGQGERETNRILLKCHVSPAIQEL
jgi:hypothetical protein